MTIVSFMPSLLIPSGFRDIFLPDPRLIALLIVALFLLPPSFLLTPPLPLLFVRPSLILVPGVLLSLIPRNVLLGPVCTPLVPCFGICS
jgi:hypothetical protein